MSSISVNPFSSFFEEMSLVKFKKKLSNTLNLQAKYSFILIFLALYALDWNQIITERESVSREPERTAAEGNGRVKQK